LGGCPACSLNWLNFGRYSFGVFSMTRQEMIYALTKFELQYLIDNPECLDDECAQWWIKGGFNNYANADLIRNCEMNIWPELEVQT
jgi:hypothetical protein